MRQLTKEEMKKYEAGDPVSLTLVLTYLAVALVTIAVWRMFKSKKGKLVFPGGFTFEWSGSDCYLPFYIWKLVRYLLKNDLEKKQ